MAYLPILAGLVAALLWGSSDYIAGLAARKIGEYATNAYVFLFGAVTILLAALPVGIATQANAATLLLGALFSIPTFFGVLLYYRAYRIGDFAINAPISGSYPVVIVLGFVFILGHALTILETVGLAVTVLGIILVSTRLSQLRKRRKMLAAGVGSSLAAMVLMGIPSIFAGVYAAVIGFLLLSLMWRAVPALIAFLGGYATGQNISLPKKKIMALVLAAGIMDGAALSIYLLGISLDSLALPIISTLSGLTGAVTVVYGLVLLRERPETNQWLGIALAIAGAAILSYVSSL